MDRLGTWEVPLTSTCERTGRSGRRLNNGPGPEVPSDLLGAQVAKHEARRIAWTPEDRCTAGFHRLELRGAVRLVADPVEVPILSLIALLSDS
jgi:hypothetical protein